MTEYRFSWESGRLKSVANGYVDFTKPFYTRSYDSSGRAVKVVYTATMDRTPNVTSTETVEFDSKGDLPSMHISRTTGERITVKVETQPSADGTKTFHWVTGEGRFRESMTLTVDKDGNISDTACAMGDVGSSITVGGHLSRNSHGDVDSSSNVRTGKTDARYEYEYDPQGNWTRLSEYQLTDLRGTQQKTLTSVYTRQISYFSGAQTAPPTEAPTTDESFKGTVAGTYKAQMGDPANGSFYSKMVLELKPDGTVALSNTMPDIQNRGQEMTNHAEGNWGRTADRVVIILEKGNGKEIAAEDPQRTLSLTISDDGNQLASDGGPDFHRQK